MDTLSNAIAFGEVVLLAVPGAALEPILTSQAGSIGGLDQLQVIDNLTRLWFALARGRNMGRRLAFKVLTPAP